VVDVVNHSTAKEMNGSMANLKVNAFSKGESIATVETATNIIEETDVE
jgi:hypothetical protein